MQKSEKEIIQDIFSHKYYVRGECFKCGAKFEKLTNSRGISSCCCSDKCAKEAIADKKRRNKERHHYEVFKDDKYYYIRIDGIYEERRNHNGRTWMLKSAQDRNRAKEPIFLKDWRHSILSIKSTIPKNAIKIIDKISAYLYDELHPFDRWKTLEAL